MQRCPNNITELLTSIKRELINEEIIVLCATRWPFGFHLSAAAGDLLAAQQRKIKDKNIEVKKSKKTELPKEKIEEASNNNNNELEDLEASKNAEACRLLDEEKQQLEEQLKAANARIRELEAQNVNSRAPEFASSTPKETRIRVEKEVKSEAEDCEQLPAGKLDFDESKICAECESLHWVVEKLNDEVATFRTKMNESILREEASTKEVSRLASELQKSLETSERFNETRSHCNELQLSLSEKENKAAELERLNEQLNQTIEQLKYKQSLS